MDESRKQFEEWITNTSSDLLRVVMIKRREDGIYRHLATENKWKAWQASRAAIEIELPEWFSPHDCGDKVMWSDAVEQAIRAAGIKVKE